MNGLEWYAGPETQGIICEDEETEKGLMVRRKEWRRPQRKLTQPYTSDEYLIVVPFPFSFLIVFLPHVN